MTAYLELADYLLIAERVLGLPARAIANFDRLKPAGTHRIWPEPTVATVLSRTPPDARRDSGMRYQVSSSGPI